MKNRLHLPLRLLITLLAIVCVSSIVQGHGWAPGAPADSLLVEALGGDGTTAVALPPAPLLCRPAGSPMLQPSASTGHHRVILSWNPSIPPAGSDGPVVYCLYRSKTKGAAEKNATCSDCEQINSIPVTGTGCVDDLVEDGAAYYYVVTAMTTMGKPSPSSNETPATIPATKERVSPASEKTYPLCRSSAQK